MEKVKAAHRPGFQSRAAARSVGKFDEKDRLPLGIVLRQPDGRRVLFRVSIQGYLDLASVPIEEIGPILFFFFRSGRGLKEGPDLGNGLLMRVDHGF